MSVKRIGVLILVVFALVLFPTVALAHEGETDETPVEETAPPVGTDEAFLELHAPDGATVGTKIELKATLTDWRGEPIKGARIFFSSPTQFFGVAKEMDVDDALTNAQGIATIQFEPRQEGENTIIARFKGNSTFGASEATGTFTVEGGTQTYIEQAGVKIPYLGPWVIVLVLAAVWGLYLTVMALVVRIANSPRASEGGWR